jgi:hypothetical protein
MSTKKLLNLTDRFVKVTDTDNGIHGGVSFEPHRFRGIQKRSDYTTIYVSPVRGCPDGGFFHVSDPPHLIFAEINRVARLIEEAQ